MQLTTQTTDDGRVLVLSGRGELDISTLELLRTELVDAIATDAETVVVDLTEVGYIDSSGLGVLVGAHRRMASENRAFVLRVSSPEMIKLLKITGLEHLFALEMPYEGPGEGSAKGQDTGSGDDAPAPSPEL